MIQQLIDLDSQIFIFINHLPHNFLLDTFFGFLTLIGYLGVIWLLIAFFLFSKNRKKFKRLLTSVVTSVLITLIFVEAWLKQLIGRTRPKFNVTDIKLPYDFFQSYSFPSGHATIAFAAAYILGREHKELKGLYYFLAILISFSRIYLGKHYPFDVLAGALIGLLIGFSSLKIVNILR